MKYWRIFGSGISVVTHQTWKAVWVVRQIPYFFVITLRIYIVLGEKPSMKYLWKTVALFLSSWDLFIFNVWLGCWPHVQLKLKTLAEISSFLSDLSSTKPCPLWKAMKIQLCKSLSSLALPTEVVLCCRMLFVPVLGLSQQVFTAFANFTSFFISLLMRGDEVP